MKIVIIAPFAIEPKGTVSARIIPIAKNLAKLGNNVIVVIMPHDNIKYSGIKYKDEGVTVVNMNICSPRTLNKFILALKTVNFVVRQKPQIVHIFKPISYSGISGMIIKIFTSIIVAVDFDDWEGRGGWNDVFELSIFRRAILRLQEKWALRNANLVTLASRALETIVWSLGVSPKRTFYLPNCPIEPIWSIRPNRKLNSKKKIVLFAGHLSWEDDIDLVIQVIHSLIQKRNDINYIIIGQGKNESEVKKLIKEMKIEKYINLSGRVNYEKYKNMINTADVIIRPYHDNLRNRTKCSARITEYMLAAKPIVTNSVGQVIEYLDHNISGFIARAGDVEGLVRGVELILEDNLLANKLGSNAREKINHQFQWIQWVSQLLERYENCISRL